MPCLHQPVIVAHLGLQGLIPPPSRACGDTSPGWSNAPHLTLP